MKPITKVMTKAKLMKSASLDAFDDLVCDGKLGPSLLKALNLVEEYPDRTVKELLEIGVDAGVYPHPDRNLIAPRITGLKRKIRTYSPSKRVCTVTGKVVEVHREASEEMKDQRRRLWQESKGKVAKYPPMEFESNTDPWTIHTTIWWHDGTITCTCNDKYGRPPEYRCHHVKGLYYAKTGKMFPDRLQDDLEDETEMINNLEVG